MKKRRCLAPRHSYKNTSARSRRWWRRTVSECSIHLTIWLPRKQGCSSASPSFREPWPVAFCIFSVARPPNTQQSYVRPSPLTCRWCCAAGWATRRSMQITGGWAHLPITAGGLGLPDLPALALAARTAALATIPNEGQLAAYKEELLDREGPALLHQLQARLAHPGSGIGGRPSPHACRQVHATALQETDA